LKAILVFLEKFSLIFFEPTTDAIEKYGISHGLLVTVIRKPTSCRKRRAPGENTEPKTGIHERDPPRLMEQRMRSRKAISVAPNIMPKFITSMTRPFQIVLSNPLTILPHNGNGASRNMDRNICFCLHR
jgi:hypothetical protein